MSRRFRSAALLAALVAAFLGGSGVRGDEGEWPQWRGPAGLGVSTERGLPAAWSRGGDNVRWVAEVPGEGISSPIVSRGRVFLTTAYEGRAPGFSKGLLRASTLVLAALILLELVLRARRRGPVTGAALADSLLTGLAALAFLGLAGLVALGPEAIGSFLEGLRGRADLGGLERALSWVPGNEGPIWIVSGGIALLGVAAAFGGFGAGSKWRLGGAVAVAFAAALHVAARPPDQYTNPIPAWHALAVDAPALLLAAWYALRYAGARGRQPEPDLRPPAALLRAAPLLLAALVFVPANYLQPRLGLLRAVLAYDLATGKLLWNEPVLTAPAERKHVRNTYATPTPCTDGRRVYAYFGSGLAGLDFDGRVEWRRRYPDYTPNSRYGTGASPVLSRDAVVVVQERERVGTQPTWMAAFSKETGDPLWRVESDDASHSYATPLLIDRGGRVEMLAVTHKALVARDAKTGEPLWSYPHGILQMVPSLAREGDLLAIAGGTHSDQETRVLRLAADGSVPPYEELWSGRRNVPEISSPVLYRGMLFTVDKVGIMTCADARTGEVHWKKRLGGQVFASLLAADGKVYASGLGGITRVVAAAPEYELLAENDLGEPIAASPAVAGGCLLIRTASRLYCIGEPRGVESAS